MEPAFYQPRKAPPPTTGLSLFDPPPAEPEHVPPPTPPVGVIPETESVLARRRREKVEALHAAGSRRWINAGKPIALLVVRRDGKVTAETFRTAAEALRPQRRARVLPPTYGEDRTLSYLSSMFAELVREGRIEKLLRIDGSVVKVPGGERNEHVVYVPARRAT